RKEGDTFKLSFSVNGTDFVDMGTKTMALNDPKLVIYAANGMGSLKDGTSTADVTETPVIVKDLQVTDLNSAGQPEVQVTTIKASQPGRSEEHTSELQSRFDLVCRLLLEKKKNKARFHTIT